MALMRLNLGGQLLVCRAQCLSFYATSANADSAQKTRNAKRADSSSQKSIQEDSVIRCSVTYPMRTALRAKSCKGVSGTGHSPSDRKMTTGILELVLWGTIGVRMVGPPVCAPAPSHDSICNYQSPCVVGAISCTIVQDGGQKIVGRTCRVVLQNNLSQAIKNYDSIRVPPSSAGQDALTSSPERPE